TGGTADRNRSHWSTSKTPSYTKSVSWQHHRRFLDEIKKQGLIAGERHYVHLSADEATARKVGARHGSPVILTVKAQEMAKRGIPFWQAENGVWLTSTVAVEFLEW
ncbi:RNA 2'-phosphotransferase, partial [Escherichia coli]|uniref:RNA 2'-phosphotransferase n=1 Tax=Escherichia coli TaxID=562 RepID=UPI00203D465A